MKASKTWLCYRPAPSKSRIGSVLDILSRYSFFFIFIVFKLFDWRFDRAQQETLDLAHNISSIVFPAPSLKNSSFPNAPVNTINSSEGLFKKKNPEKKMEEVGSRFEIQGLCRLCLKEAKEQVILPQSVYVYCRPCLVSWIDEKGTCPQSGVPVDKESIIQLFV